MASRFNFGLGNLADGLSNLGKRDGESAGPGEMPFLDHLEELRWRIIWSLGAFVLMGGIGIWLSFHFQLIGVLIDPARPYLDCSYLNASKTAAEIAALPPCDPRLAFTSITDPMFIQLKLGLLMGLLLSFPVIAYQAWAFLSPALHRNEKKVIVPALYGGLVLFVAGALLAYFYVLPATAKLMLSFVTRDMKQTIGIASYIDMATKLMVVFGLVFELPIVILVLSSLGLITSRFLKNNRRYAIAIMAVAAAMLTPGDAISATLYMMLPLMFLFEISIWMVVAMEKRRSRTLAALKADEPADDQPVYDEGGYTHAPIESDAATDVSNDVEKW